MLVKGATADKVHNLLHAHILDLFLQNTAHDSLYPVRRSSHAIKMIQTVGRNISPINNRRIWSGIVLPVAFRESD